MTQAALDCARIGATTHIDETDRVIHSFLYAAARFYVLVCLPAVTDDCSAGFDPVTKNSLQCVGGMSRTGYRNFFRTRAHHLRTPAVLYFVSPILREPYERAFVDYDGLVGTDSFLRAARHVVQHDLSRGFGPKIDGCRTELMLLLDSVMWIAMNDVVREE